METQIWRESQEKRTYAPNPGSKIQVSEFPSKHAQVPGVPTEGGLGFINILLSNCLHIPLPFSRIFPAEENRHTNLPLRTFKRMFLGIRK
ncbi:uncharacterized protein LOC144374982 [Ictidomys tridecemlineatus]